MGNVQKNLAHRSGIPKLSDVASTGQVASESLGYASHPTAAGNEAPARETVRKASRSTPQDDQDTTGMTQADVSLQAQMRLHVRSGKECAPDTSNSKRKCDPAQRNPPFQRLPWRWLTRPASPALGQPPSASPGASPPRPPSQTPSPQPLPATSNQAPRAAHSQALGLPSGPKPDIRAPNTPAPGALGTSTGAHRLQKSGSRQKKHPNA